MKKLIAIIGVITLGAIVVSMDIYTYKLSKESKIKVEKIEDGIHYQLNRFGVDTIWIRYDTLVRKRFSKDKPKEYRLYDHAN